MSTMEGDDGGIGEGTAQRPSPRVTARDLLFQPRRSVTAHRPGLEGVQGEEGVKEPHFDKFDRKGFPPSSICLVLPRIGRRSALDSAPREHTPADPARFRLEIRRVICPVRSVRSESCPGSIRLIDRPLVGGERVFSIEDEDLPIVEGEFRRLPFEIIAPPPVLERRLDLVTPPPSRRHVARLHHLDVERRTGRRRESKNSLPESVQSQEEFDLIAPDHGPGSLHRSFAARANHRILSPDLLYEIAPQGAQGAGAFWRGRRKNEERCRAGFCRFRPRGLLHRRARPARAGIHASALVRVETIVSHGLLALRRDVLHGGGEEVAGGEDLEFFLGVPTALGPVDHLPGRFVPGDLLQRERRTQEILSEASAPVDIIGGDWFLPGVEAEPAVGPAKKLPRFLFANELFSPQRLDEAVAEEFAQRLDAFHRHEVKAPVAIDHAGSGEDMKVGMEVQVIAEGLHGGDGSKLSVRQVEPSTHPFAQALDTDVEKVVEELATLAEDAAQGPGHGENELPVRHLEADIVGDPVAQGADAALVATGAEMPGLAGEGEELFVATVGALEPGESGGEIAAAVKLVHHRHGVPAQRAVSLAMAGFVVGDKLVPGIMDDLPQR